MSQDYGLKKPFCFHIAHEQRGTHIFAAQSEVEMQVRLLYLSIFSHWKEWLRYLKQAASSDSNGSHQSGLCSFFFKTLLILS